MRHGAWVKNGATGKHGERRMDCIARRHADLRTGNEATGERIRVTDARWDGGTRISHRRHWAMAKERE